MEEIRSRTKSFRHAFEGIKHTLITQKNFQIQVLVGFCVLLAAFLLELARWEWIILTILVGMVLASELLNTVVEVVVDLAVKEKLLPEAKIAKDVAAASVLLTSVVAVIVGVLLFWPHILDFFVVFGA